MKLGMVIDLHRCIGCHACAVSCRVANNLPEHTWYCHVETKGGDTVDSAGGSYPNNTMDFYPVNCMHCDNPACLPACPQGAISKEEGSGIVLQDQEKCIGCGLCIEACPYDGVRTLIDGIEFELDFAAGDVDAPPHKSKTVEKCTFCHHRTSRGEKPACIELCVGRARFFGDLDDPDSDVSKLLASRSYHRLLEDKGTNPNIFYLD